MAVLKICTKCGKKAQARFFRPRRSVCKDCTRSYGSAWYRANRDKVNEKRRAGYARNRVKMRAVVRKKLGQKRRYDIGWRWADEGAAWMGRPRAT